MIELNYPIGEDSIDNLDEMNINYDDCVNASDNSNRMDNFEPKTEANSSDNKVNLKIRKLLILIYAICIFLGVVYGISKIKYLTNFFEVRKEYARLIESEDIYGLVEYIKNEDRGVLDRNSKLSEKAYELIYSSALEEMKYGSLNTAYDFLDVLPSDYNNTAEFMEKIEFYIPYNKKYTHAYSPYKLTIIINIDPDSDDIYVKCNEQSLLDDTIPYKSTFISKKGKNYSISFDMKTCEYKFVTNNHISTKSGRYNY